MKISVILAHPSPSSFNHAIAETTCRTLHTLGHQVYYHDLYRERFDPLLPAEELASDAPLCESLQPYCNEIVESNGIVVVHPNWWGQPPAILKGWMDRVLRPGIAYRFSDKGAPVGLLKAEAAVVFNTSNTPADLEQKLFGDPLENLWKTCVLSFCGVEKTVRRVFGPVIVSSIEQRLEWLKEVETTIGNRFPAAGQVHAVVGAESNSVRS